MSAVRYIREGTASVARGYSTYVDSIFDQAMQKAFTECCGMDVDFLSAYPDFFALFLVMVLTCKYKIAG
ncbi:hypothetical protein FJT64_024393 [Amphibalanus amphitrite]|uniref:Uncharacterized protein n=1 Tax=Amphibalanus amphitrite TaxID=1232801 RepID=A0A6A4WM24_AMPAM|nr:hypothetical protein FJT64_024393 [Amphibalanus amphitrite]